ncbi:hypothetical protein Aasi_0225 [Candidatus Amoebophilus asiaticus 5a2]|uniref:Uncharacterized protein n=1 Tax=Amoebophilus asiaticus (strain 5a2) TaxID=452471 RepID=B3ER17_AMOA5|nr:ankyrin repeat domain-containing protein [Candidatus Amoebophilus asiaticus]ACE05669.1 hypothetical protein Aasi_0225 [Candidatus Amoebophilus asiaticus 5a2]
MKTIEEFKNKLYCCSDNFLCLIFVLVTVISCECNNKGNKGRSGIPTLKYNINAEVITDDMINTAKAAGKNFLADILTKLQKNETVDIDACNYNYWSERNHTALMQAVEIRSLPIVKALIARGAKVNTIYGENAALHVAASFGYTEILLELIEHGADVNIKGREWGGNAPLHYAAESGHVETIAKLIEKGAELNTKNIYGNTPLHFAAQAGHIEAILKLLEKGGDIDAKNQIDEETPLHLASGSGHTNAVVKLIEKGAIIDIKNIDGDTPLHRAARFGHTETVLKLLEKGAELNTKNIDGNTPLHFAAQAGHRETVLRLIEYSIKLNIKNTYIDTKDICERTPLHVAALYNQQTATVLELIKQGATIDIQDGEGNTPLHNAAWRGHLNVVHALVNARAKKDIHNNKGQIPLDLATSEEVKNALK